MLTIFLIKNDIFFIYKKNKELTRVTRSKLVTRISWIGLYTKLDLKSLTIKNHKFDTQ